MANGVGKQVQKAKTFDWSKVKMESQKLRPNHKTQPLIPATREQWTKHAFNAFQDPVLRSAATCEEIKAIIKVHFQGVTKGSLLYHGRYGLPSRKALNGLLTKLAKDGELLMLMEKFRDQATVQRSELHPGKQRNNAAKVKRGLTFQDKPSFIQAVQSSELP